MRRVTFCERSTISEAVVSVRGLPAPVNPEEIAAVIHGARRAFHIEDESQAEVLRLEDAQGEPVAPYWQHELRWNSRRNMARVAIDPALVNSPRKTSLDPIPL